MLADYGTSLGAIHSMHCYVVDGSLGRFIPIMDVVKQLAFSCRDSEWKRRKSADDQHDVSIDASPSIMMGEMSRIAWCLWSYPAVMTADDSAVGTEETDA